MIALYLLNNNPASKSELPGADAADTGAGVAAGAIFAFASFPFASLTPFLSAEEEVLGGIIIRNKRKNVAQCQQF